MTETAVIKPVHFSDLAVGKGGLEFRTFDEMYRFCDMLAQSGFAPKGMTAAQVMGAVQYGLEIGVPPMQALTGIAVINGRPSVWGDLALAIVRRHHEFEWIAEAFDPKLDGGTAFCEIQRTGEPPCRRGFSMEQAKKAKLHEKDTYRQYPERMLQMRARAWAMRDSFADALKGMSIAEESRDIPANGAPPEPRSLKAAFERTALPSPAAAVLEAGGDLPEADCSALKARVLELAKALDAKGKPGLVPGDWETYAESGLADLVAYLEEELATG